MKNLFDVKGKIALITGSSRGIGYTLAEGLLESGAKVILNGREKDTLNQAVNSFKEKDRDVHGSIFDVNKKEEIESELARIEKEIGAIDILVNNAGINIRKNLEDLSLEEWQKVIDINLTGVFLVGQAVAKAMIKRNKGKIINICSLQSELARNTIAAYAASKGGVKMLTKSMATEWAKYNIQVNGIGPGYFLTDLTKPLSDDPKFDSWLKNRTPAARWGNTKELVGTLIYLSSEASDFVNGHIVYVDGGFLATV
jgi:gluconate 5-dehydrogenase